MKVGLYDRTKRRKYKHLRDAAIREHVLNLTILQNIGKLEEILKTIKNKEDGIFSLHISGRKIKGNSISWTKKDVFTSKSYGML